MTFQLPHHFPFHKASCRPAQPHDVPFYPATSIQPILCFACSLFHFWTLYISLHSTCFHIGKICTVSYIYSTWHIIYFFLFMKVFFYAFLNKVAVNVYKRMQVIFIFPRVWEYSRILRVCLISATKWSKPVINICIYIFKYVLLIRTDSS